MSGHQHNTEFFDGCREVFPTTFQTVVGSVKPEYIQEVIKEYIDQNEIPTGRTTYVTLRADAWVKESERKYSQVVEVDGVTENSELTIKISAEQLEAFHPKDLSFVACNEDGEVTFYAVGWSPPKNDYVVEIKVAEVKR